MIAPRHPLLTPERTIMKTDTPSDPWQAVLRVPAPWDSLPGILRRKARTLGGTHGTDAIFRMLADAMDEAVAPPAPHTTDTSPMPVDTDVAEVWEYDGGEHCNVILRGQKELDDTVHFGACEKWYECGSSVIHVWLSPDWTRVTDPARIAYWVASYEAWRKSLQAPAAPPIAATPVPAPLEMTHEEKLRELFDNPVVGDEWGVNSDEWGVNSDYFNPVRRLSSITPFRVVNGKGEPVSTSNYTAVKDYWKEFITSIRLAPRAKPPQPSPAVDSPPIQPTKTYAEWALQETIAELRAENDGLRKSVGKLESLLHAKCMHPGYEYKGTAPALSERAGWNWLELGDSRIWWRKKAASEARP